jgi:hypothetical protein
LRSEKPYFVLIQKEKDNLINIQINLLFKRKFPIGLTSKFGNLVWPNARAALVLSVSPMFYTGFESLNSVDGLWFPHQPIKIYVKNFATDGASYQTMFLG